MRKKVQVRWLPAIEIGQPHKAHEHQAKVATSGSTRSRVVPWCRRPRRAARGAIVTTPDDVLSAFSVPGAVIGTTPTTIGHPWRYRSPWRRFVGPCRTVEQRRDAEMFAAMAEADEQVQNEPAATARWLWRWMTR